MAMSKKHYTAIAKAIRDTLVDVDPLDVQTRVSIGHIIIRIADVFTEDNPNFNRRRFHSACVESLT